MSRHFAQSVTILRAPLATDRYGNEKRDWGAATRTTINGINMQPASSPTASDEETTDRQVAVTGWHLYTPRGMDLDLLETDRVEYAGMTLEMVGKVGRWEIGGRVHHVEAELKEVA